MLALAVVAQAVAIDLWNPVTTLPAASWLLESDVLPADGPVSRRAIRPQVLAAVEDVLAGKISWRHRRRLPDDHRPRLVELLRRHRTP